MRRLLLLAVFAGLFIVALPVAAEEPSEELDTVTYLFEWEVTSVRDLWGDPLPPPPSVGDVGTGYLTIADWTPTDIDEWQADYLNVPGLELALQLGTDRYEAAWNLGAVVWNDFPAPDFKDASSFLGSTGPEWDSSVSLLLSLWDSDPGLALSGLEIPLDLRLEDFNYTVVSLINYDSTDEWWVSGEVTSLGLFEPEGLLSTLAGTIRELNLDNGISNSLDAKLANAVKALEDTNESNNVAAINKLAAFINGVEAQTGKKISVGDADVLIAQARQLIDLLVFVS